MYVCSIVLFSTEYYVLSIQKYKQVNTACGLRTLDFSMIALALLLFCLTYLVLKTAIVRLLIFLTFNFFFTKDLGQSILIYLKDFLSPNKSKHLPFRTGYSFQKRFEKKEEKIFQENWNFTCKNMKVENVFSKGAFKNDVSIFLDSPLPCQQYCLEQRSRDIIRIQLDLQVKLLWANRCHSFLTSLIL